MRPKKECEPFNNETQKDIINRSTNKDLRANLETKSKKALRVIQQMKQNA